MQHCTKAMRSRLQNPQQGGWELVSLGCQQRFLGSVFLKLRGARGLGGGELPQNRYEWLRLMNQTTSWTLTWTSLPQIVYLKDILGTILRCPKGCDLCDCSTSGFVGKSFPKTARNHCGACSCWVKPVWLLINSEPAVGAKAPASLN